jgi:glycosyltransferase involved in cell wall biosynthesis
MNILFLTLSTFRSIDDRGIYPDLLRLIIRKGHSVFIVNPVERRFKQFTELKKEQNCQILRVRTLNIQKTNLIEKGIGTLLIEHQFKAAIKKFLVDIKFDLIIYSTPPITFNQVIAYFKRRDGAKTYLLLKDIFPQNAVDLGIFRRGGLLHKYFRKKESALYAISDRIGCMSPANLDYLCKQNPDLDYSRLHVNPNSIELNDFKMNGSIERKNIRAKYNIPENVTMFIYGGNLGKPQGINFLLEILTCYLNSHELFFIIAGSGTEFDFVSIWFNSNKPSNALLIPFLPKSQFDELLSVADVGLIFLDPRFTIPNFPSRLLSYMEFSLPVLAATDLRTDIGRIAMENEFGFWCESGDITSFCNYIDCYSKNRELRLRMGMNGYKYLKANWTVDISYSIIFEK